MGLTPKAQLLFLLDELERRLLTPYIIQLHKALCDQINELADRFGFPKHPVRVSRTENGDEEHDTIQTYVITDPLGDRVHEIVPISTVIADAPETLRPRLSDSYKAHLRSAFDPWRIYIQHLPDNPTAATDFMQSADFRLRWNITANRLDHARRAGRLHAEKRGGRWYYSKSEVERLFPEVFSD